MKKIYGITIVKNESDIIESFFRYNLTYCDGILVYEGKKSTDNTAWIIRKLIEEGLPIHSVDELADPQSLTTIKSYDDLRKAMAMRAISAFNADLIIPLDADEFLYHTDGFNPRETLEGLQENVEYRVPWRTYVYPGEAENNQVFLPNRFTHYRNPLFETLNKVLISRYLIEEMEISFVPGCHHVLYPGERFRRLPVEAPSGLVYAHFPLRSKHQLMKKVIINRIHKWKIQTVYQKEKGFQLSGIFDELKNNGDISQENILHHSMKYSVRDEHFYEIQENVGEKILIKEPMNLSFCADKLSLCYTDTCEDEKALIKGMLTEIDSTINHLIDSRYSSETIGALSRQLEEIYNTRTWKAGTVIKRIYRFFIKFHASDSSG